MRKVLPISKMLKKHLFCVLLLVIALMKLLKCQIFSNLQVMTVPLIVPLIPLIVLPVHLIVLLIHLIVLLVPAIALLNLLKVL